VSDEPCWLTREAVLAIHAQLLARFGGSAGIREDNMLESALAKPRQLHAYGQPNVYEMAAAYAFGIVKNHPFVDGNKRAGFVAAYTFLGINGFDFTAPEEEAVIFTRGLAAGEITLEEYTLWLQKSSRSTVL
jgi:death on curing protein